MSSPNPRFPTCPGGVAAVAILLALTGQVATPTRAGTADDVPTIDNPRIAPSTRTVVMEEFWRAGGDDEDYLFGVIGRAVSDDAGNVYLLDNQQQEVFAFDPEGAYLGLISRKGEGPGEIDRVYHMDHWDENVLGLLKGFPASLILVSMDGLPAGDLKLTAAASSGEERYLSASHFERRDGHLVAMATQKCLLDGQWQEIRFLAAFDAVGHERHRYGEKPHGYDFKKTIVVDELGDFFPLNRWALGREGEVYLAPERDAYLVEVRDPAGALLRRIRRAAEAHHRSAAEKEEAKRGWSFASSGAIPEIRYKIADTDPLIGGLQWRNDELWVTTSAGERHRSDGVAACFDVLDRAGNLIEERSYVLPFDQDEDRLIFLDAHRAVRIKAYRSAQEARSAGLKVQIGTERVETAGGGEEMLEVILYRAVE